MLEEILATVDKNAREEITITKGLALIIIVGSFLIGMIIGGACGSGSTRRKITRTTASEEEFDADEYVKSLKFEEE